MCRLTQGALALAAVAAMLGAVTRAAAADCPDLQSGELGVGLIDHSCFHTTNGPFATVTATPGTTATAATPNIDEVHTHFSVTIDPAQHNVVTYMPVRTGNWAIFGHPDVPHTVLDAAGQPVPVELVHMVPACSGIPIVRVYALTALNRYTLRLGPSATPATTTIVVVEKVSDFETQHGRDGDGDGFGGGDDVVATACVPPAGYVRDVTDCDDDRPDIHPEASERCDGVDDNCNGIADDGACSVSGGGCAGAPHGSGDRGALVVVAALAIASLARRRSRR